MGKKIDAFVFSVLVAGGFYMYFYRSIGNHAAAFALSGLCFLILKKMVRKTVILAGNNRWLQQRKIRRESGSTLMWFACNDHETVQQSVMELVRRSYGCDYPLELVQMHPSTALNAEKIFEIWKKHQGEEQLVICATCACSTEARVLYRSLKQPKIAILDASSLSHMIAEHPDGVFVPPEQAPSKRFGMRAKHIWMLMTRRSNAFRCALFSISMLMMYILSANVACLAASMALLLVVLASLRHSGRPAKLF